MKRERSIALLNQSVADELLAVHQYMYFHVHLDDQGFGPLAALFKRTAITEMGHVEALSERILFLKGDVEMSLAGTVEKITDPAAMLARARQMEESSTHDYNKAALECAAGADAASKQLFEKLIGDEEGHFAEFDRQLEHVNHFGPSSLALQSFQSGPAGKA
jgi:bacterioferritin